MDFVDFDFQKKAASAIKQLTFRKHVKNKYHKRNGTTIALLKAVKSTTQEGRLSTMEKLKRMFSNSVLLLILLFGLAPTANALQSGFGYAELNLGSLKTTTSSPAAT